MKQKLQLFNYIPLLLRFNARSNLSEAEQSFIFSSFYCYQQAALLRCSLVVTAVAVLQSLAAPASLR